MGITSLATRIQTFTFAISLALSLVHAAGVAAQTSESSATSSAEVENSDALTPFTILPPLDGNEEAAVGSDNIVGRAQKGEIAAENRVVSDQLTPAVGELPPAFTAQANSRNSSDSVSPNDGEFPPAFVPGVAPAWNVPPTTNSATEAPKLDATETLPLDANDLVEPEAPILSTSVAEIAREGGDFVGVPSPAPIATENAHLDSVFPSLPAPPANQAAVGTTHLPLTSPNSVPPSADGIPRVSQYGDPGIMYEGQPLDTTPAAEQPAAPLDTMMPGQTAGWWQPHVGTPMRNTAMPRSVSINGLVAAALQHSSQVKVISDTPLIRDTAIIEADSAFDWATFMETTWNDTNEPVGSTLTTGGPPRFRNSRFNYEAGLRRQTGIGGQFEASQRYGHENSNSVFFVPNDQGTSRLTLSYTQPLLRGAGRAYNTSLIVLAQVDSAIARDDFSRQLQEHLLDVTRSYWTLYLERASLLQRQRLYDRGQEILKELEYREEIDAVQNQIVRARAAVASRKSDLFRAAAAVKNAEGRIRALVNAPDLGVLDEFELTPSDMPTVQMIPVDMRESLEMAIRSRPEINVAMKQIKASAVRLKMSKNELLPLLDVVLETYVAGLQGNSGIGSAFAQQFSDGSPSYTAGLQFEVPLRNRAARARFQRRNIELRQFESQFQNTLQALQLEIEIAVREVHTSFREIEANGQSMKAAAAEVDYIAHRWELLPGEDRAASLILEDLLAAQERLAAEEFEFSNAQVNYNLALMNLKRTMGTLLQCEQVAVAKSEDSGIPSLWLHKAGVSPTGYEQPALEFGPE